MFALVVALFAAACTSGDDSGAASTSVAGTSAGATSPSGQSAAGKVRFGAFNFTESTILANIYAEAAKAAGVPAEVVPDVGPREEVYQLLFKGELSVVPEYSGSAVLALGGEETSDPVEMHDALTDLMEVKGVAVLDSADAVNRDAIAITLDTATRLNVHTMSELSAVARDLTLGGPAECPARPLCIPGLEATYGIEFKGFIPLDPGVQTASSLARDEVGAALVFTTDATISPFTLVLLDDDKGLYPAENITPVVRQEVLDEYPELAGALNEVSAAMTTRELRRAQLHGGAHRRAARQGCEDLAGRPRTHLTGGVVDSGPWSNGTRRSRSTARPSTSSPRTTST